ncbi:hypothetical protein CL654_00360 [bacterium]|nr:hypothetical protein [bacterium]
MSERKRCYLRGCGQFEEDHEPNGLQVPYRHRFGDPDVQREGPSELRLFLASNLVLLFVSMVVEEDPLLPLVTANWVSIAQNFFLLWGVIGITTVFCLWVVRAFKRDRAKIEISPQEPSSTEEAPATR